MRREGPMGALMDEYQKALWEFIERINDIDQKNFEKVVDNETDNPDCKSCQTVINHVMFAGYGYSNYIRKKFGKPVEDIIPPITEINTAGKHLKDMFEYMLMTVDELMDLPEDQFGNYDIPVRWSQEYDLEQLLEHAIVHILRHRRQIEHFKQKLEIM